MNSNKPYSLEELSRETVYFFVTAELKKNASLFFFYMEKGDSLSDNTYIFRVKDFLKVSLIFSNEKWDIHSL